MRLNVIVFDPFETSVAALKLPSDACWGASLLVALIVMTPPLILAPPVTSVDTVGVILALAAKKFRLSAPPVVLLVLASASLRLNARALMSPLVMITDDAPPSVADTPGVPCAVEFESAIAI